MKILYYLTDVLLGCTNGRHLDMAIEEINKGNEVFVLHCDNSIGLCVTNCGRNPLFCKFCMYSQKNDMRFLKGKMFEEHWIGEYVSKIDKSTLPKFKYNSAKEYRNLEYKDVEIGIGAMSSYISLTRNLNPVIDDQSRPYLDQLIEEQIITIEVLEMIQAQYRFDLMVFGNGRGAQFKPFLNLCKKWNIGFWCTEWLRMGDGKVYMNNFWCDHAHSHRAYYKKFVDCWESSKDSIKDREKIAISFFENRRNSKYSGDEIYTRKQHLGVLPEGWNKNVTNIVIFNSSQDEYAAVGKDIDKEALFPSHLDGIKRILDHYKESKDVFFTLRIHPNLSNIIYSYQTDLYKLNYKNLRVIPGDSPVSSYSLIDAADKVIIFGSTIGIEAAYWGKPVITLDYVIYKDLEVIYKPGSESELWELINNPHLPCLFNDKGLYYGYFVMSNNHERTKFVDIDIYSKKFLKWDFICARYQKLFKSNFMYALIIKILYKLKMKYPANYKCIKFPEAIKG